MNKFKLSAIFILIIAIFIGFLLRFPFYELVAYYDDIFDNISQLSLLKKSFFTWSPIHDNIFFNYFMRTRNLGGTPVYIVGVLNELFGVRLTDFNFFMLNLFFYFFSCLLFFSILKKLSNSAAGIYSVVIFSALTSSVGIVHMKYLSDVVFLELLTLFCFIFYWKKRKKLWSFFTGISFLLLVMHSPILFLDYFYFIILTLLINIDGTKKERFSLKTFLVRLIRLENLLIILPATFIVSGHLLFYLISLYMNLGVGVLNWTLNIHHTSFKIGSFFSFAKEEILVNGLVIFILGAFALISFLKSYKKLNIIEYFLVFWLFFSFLIVFLFDQRVIITDHIFLTPLILTVSIKMGEWHEDKTLGKIIPLTAVFMFMINTILSLQLVLGRDIIKNLKPYSGRYFMGLNRAPSQKMDTNIKAVGYWIRKYTKEDDNVLLIKRDFKNEMYVAEYYFGKQLSNIENMEKLYFISEKNDLKKINISKINYIVSSTNLDNEVKGFFLTGKVIGDKTERPYLIYSRFRGEIRVLEANIAKTSYDREFNSLKDLLPTPYFYLWYYFK